ncbi:hypothetical protein [Rubrolithibacter danxiaensis]|uniref:hypothetical protein n=1 Tax=Rubrolithibacter danxiaensis TaxID=3390805 RepID=UPI003BF899A4
MENLKIINGNLSEVMAVFLQELPDPARSNESTIKDEYILNNKKVVFQAQKKKGPHGMCWNINYSS